MRNLIKWVLLLAAVVVAGPSVLKNVDINDLFDIETAREPASRPPANVPAPRGSPKVPGLVMVAMSPCTSGRRAPPSGSCVIDGDSGWLKGQQWRLEGVDAPEIGKPECAAERATGERAKRRLIDLLSTGFAAGRGKDDRYGRKLVTFKLADGRDAGEVLIAERLAQPWPNKGNVWCGR
jgi:endonuclease YncB( thermonuclease family)